MGTVAMMEMQGNGNWWAMKTENAKCGILPNTYTKVKMRTAVQKGRLNKIIKAFVTEQRRSE